MTIANPSNRGDYIGNNSLSRYPYPFAIFAATDLVCIVADPTGKLYGNSVVPGTLAPCLTLGTDFNPDAVNDNDAGGNVILVNSGQAWLTSGNLTASWTLTILRIRPLTQQTSLRNQGAYFPEVVESALDDIVMKITQLEEQLSRATLAAINIPPTVQPSVPAASPLSVPFTVNLPWPQLVAFAALNPTVQFNAYATDQKQTYFYCGNTSIGTGGFISEGGG